MPTAQRRRGLPRVIGKLGFFGTMQVMKKAARQLGEPMLPLAATQYFSAVPIKFGDYAVRYALRPHHRDAGGVRHKAPEYLSAELSVTVRKEAVEDGFQLQFFESEASTPIEDASVDWA